MNSTLIMAAITLLVASTIAWQYRQNQQLISDLAAAEQQLSTQQQQLTALAAAEQQRTANQRLLSTHLDRARTTLAKQQTELQRLQNENQQYRDWASQPLPDSVNRLQLQPTSTNVSHTVPDQHLPNRHPMQPANTPNEN